MLEAFERLPLHDPAQIHLLAEIAKRVFADRAEYLGDPDFWPVPVAGLTSKAYADDLRAHATVGQRGPAGPDGLQERLIAEVDV